MKSFLRIAFIAVAGILLLSCTRADKLYENSTWQGDIPVVGDMPFSPDGYTSYIKLIFRENAETCEVYYEGTCVVSTFDVEWAQRTFKLVYVEDNRPVVCYSGKISGNKMSLDRLSQDKVVDTFELKKID
jgi:hypothetical protein